MTSPATLRIGSLEIVAAIAVFGVVLAKVRPSALRVSAARAESLELRLRVQGAAGGAPRELSLTVGGEAPARIIGRSAGADVDVADPEVSRRHARLDFVDGVLYLSDAGSANGTFLNGKPVRDEGIEVRPGDDIDVGNTRISLIGTAPASWT